LTHTIDFTDHHVFVAGGTSGINLGIAKGFAESGARLSVLSRSREKVDSAVHLLSAYGAEAMGFSADVRDHDAVAQALESAHRQNGDIDVLISGAAGNFPASLLDMSSNAFRAVVDIDLIGTFHVLRYGYEFLRKPGACVINISAPQAYAPTVLQAHVCAAKAGVDMLTRSLALEWGGQGVRINSIAPGPIENTEGMARLAPTAEILETVRDSVPLKRLGQVEDIARFAMALASPLGEFVNGAVIPVDGGWGLSGFGGMMQELARISRPAGSAGS